jgi:DNA polymerase III delta prime subunit
MHAYLFVGGAVKDRNKKMQDLAEKGGKSYEFPIQKIADVRELNNFTKYTQKDKISVVIKDIDNATTEALNAFLKILEEPGKNISFFLSSTNEQNLLSTITSRCQVVRVSQSSKDNGHDLSDNFIKLSFGKKIKYLEKFKKKDEAIEFLKKIILSAHKNLINGQEAKEFALLIKTVQKTINNLNNNANVNLQLTFFAINSGKCGFTKDS